MRHKYKILIHEKNRLSGRELVSVIGETYAHSAKEAIGTFTARMGKRIPTETQNVFYKAIETD